MIQHRTDVLILGAGLLGAGVALELARRGTAVTLLDQDPRPLNRVSLRNEGKIHLGFIYAKDRSFATASLQLEGALRFRSILARWIGLDTGWLAPSTPFYYLVARDSLLGPDELAEHYAAVERRWRELIEQDAQLDYLGTRPRSLVRRLEDPEIAAHFDPAWFAGGFATAELAVDTDVLARAMRRALAASANVSFMASHAARAVSEERDGLRIEGDGPGGAYPACRGEVDPAQAREIASQIQAGIAEWYPGMARFEPLQVDAGVIVALGRSDVDDTASGLHDRSRIGVTSRGAYHSVDPGKLTTAPMFAMEAADRVEAFRRAAKVGS